MSPRPLLRVSPVIQVGKQPRFRAHPATRPRNRSQAPRKGIECSSTSQAVMPPGDVDLLGYPPRPGAGRAAKNRQKLQRKNKSSILSPLRAISHPVTAARVKHIPWRPA